MVKYARCLRCHAKWILGENEIKANTCIYCGEKHFINYFEHCTSITEKEKGGVDMANETKAKDVKETKAKSGKKFGESKYDNNIKAKAVALAKDGKTLSEIVKALNGPGPKAIQRYIMKAGLTVKK